MRLCQSAGAPLWLSCYVYKMGAGLCYLSKFSILFNGSGDGFIQPERGLRQGCDMSPYLFILSVDLLSRMLEAKVTRGEIQGVGFGRDMTGLTNIILADDLIILDQQTQMRCTL